MWFLTLCFEIEVYKWIAVSYQIIICFLTYSQLVFCINWNSNSSRSDSVRANFNLVSANCCSAIDNALVVVCDVCDGALAGDLRLIWSWVPKTILFLLWTLLFTSSNPVNSTLLLVSFPSSKLFNSKFWWDWFVSSFSSSQVFLSFFFCAAIDVLPWCVVFYWVTKQCKFFCWCLLTLYSKGLITFLVFKLCASSSWQTYQGPVQQALSKMYTWLG